MADCAVAFDVETHLVQAGLVAPPLVCASIAALGADGKVDGRLLVKDDAHQWFRRLLDDDSLVIVGANIAFDMLVMIADGARRGIDYVPGVFAAYRAGRVFDVLIAEILHAIAEGTLGMDHRTHRKLTDPIKGTQVGYSLSVVSDLVLGRTSAKVNDEWRERYAELEHLPMVEWPEVAKIYPVDDAVNTLEVALAQTGHWPRPGRHQFPNRYPDNIDLAILTCQRCNYQFTTASQYRDCNAPRYSRNLHDHSVQVYKAWCLHLAGAWGLRTDPVATEELAAAAQAQRDAGLPEFVALGYIREDGTEDSAAVKRAVALAYGCTGTCSACAGAGRVHNKFSKRDPSKPVGKPVLCKICNGTGLVLESAAVPMTEPTEKMIEDARAAGEEPRGNVQTGRDILIESGDEQLMTYGQYQEDDKILDTYVPFLREGYDAPICLRPNPVLDTGRVSYSGPIQLLPRQISARLAQALRESGSSVQGVRDCFISRPGTVFYSNDYSGGELVTFAESAVARVGWSDMGDLLNRGSDVHSHLAAKMMVISYDDFIKSKKQKRNKDFRQASKPINFGCPGGIGPVKIVLQQRKQGPDTPHQSGPSLVWDSDARAFVRGYKGLRFCILLGLAERCGEFKVTKWGRDGWERDCPPTCRRCIEAAEDLRNGWFALFTEARPYLNWHAENVDRKGEVEQLYSRRIRGGCNFTSESNGDFQALLGDIMARAQIRVSEEQYLRARVEGDSVFAGMESPLYGSRSIIFLHDELFGECREDVGHEVTTRVNEVMVEEFRRGCPNHAAACKAEPTLMRGRWWKQAELVVHRGRITPWWPGHDSKSCQECAV